MLGAMWAPEGCLLPVPLLALAPPTPPAIPELPSQLGEESLGIQLDQWQKEFIDTRAKRRAIAGARQCGKSMAVAIMAVHRMLTRADCQVIVLAKSERQSGLLVEKCRWILRKLGCEFGRDATNSVSIRLLANGSKMIGLPCSKNTIRGFTADLLILDEAAYVPDTVYMAARPMLASTDGDLVIMSTANEPVGFFWETMTRVVSAAVATVRDWFRMTVRARDVTRFSRDFLEDERRTLGAAVYAREYECVFEDSGTGVFQRSIVEAALTDEVKPLFGT